MASSAVLFLGQSKLNWITFATAIKVLTGVFLELNALVDNILALLDGFDFAAVHRAWRIVESRMSFRIMQSERFAMLSQYQQYGTFMEIFKKQDCKDNRDRVFALLGLRNADVKRRYCARL